MKLYRPVGNKTLIPVGMVIFTYTKTNPSTWFGGTWEQLSGGYLYLCASSSEKTTYTGLNTQSTTLTTNQIPSHTHTQKSCTDPGGHEHSVKTFPYSGSDASYYCISTYPGGNVNSGTHWRGGFAESAGAHTHTITLNNTGGGQGHTHNIATVGFFAWRRTA